MLYFLKSLLALIFLATKGKTTIMSGTAYFDLYDFRLRVAHLYRERNQSLASGEDAASVLERFRQGKDALFAQHPQSALDEEQRQEFRGLRYFPYNPAMCLVAEIDSSNETIAQQVVMNSEESMRMVTIGKARFVVEARTVELSLYWLDVYGGGLFLPFHDLTSPTESYGGGRYLFDTSKGSDMSFLSNNTPAGIRHITLDFNYAYNPSCAYNDQWMCPLAPLENRLPILIQAGEKKYHS